MAAGLPVVATLNGGGSDDILAHGVTGVYCGRAPASIAAALEALFDDPARRRALGVAAAEVAARRYTRARYRNDFLRLYGRFVPHPS
jgi:glycosyltransferase involved in cell wall biosynthesis